MEYLPLWIKYKNMPETGFSVITRCLTLLSRTARFYFPYDISHTESKTPIYSMWPAYCNIHGTRAPLSHSMLHLPEWKM